MDNYLLSKDDLLVAADFLEESGFSSVARYLRENASFKGEALEAVIDIPQREEWGSLRHYQEASGVLHDYVGKWVSKNAGVVFIGPLTSRTMADPENRRTRLILSREVR